MKLSYGKAICLSRKAGQRPLSLESPTLYHFIFSIVSEKCCLVSLVTDPIHRLRQVTCSVVEGDIFLLFLLMSSDVIRYFKTQKSCQPQLPCQTPEDEGNVLVFCVWLCILWPLRLLQPER